MTRRFVPLPSRAKATGDGVTEAEAHAIATDVAVVQRAEATAELTPALTAAQQDAADALAAAQQAVRATTAAVPVAVMTADYQAKADDQRIAHDSATGHTLTPLPEAQAVNRRFVFSNGYRGGSLTILGAFVTPTADGSAMVINPVLIPGASVDVICRFAVDPVGGDAQPADLRVDGSPAAANTPGRFVWDIVARNFGGGNAIAFQAAQASIQEIRVSYQPKVADRVMQAKMAAYAATLADAGVICDTTSATFAVTLPQGASSNFDFDVKWAAGTNAPTVVPGGSDSISDGSPVAIPGLKASLTFQSRGNGIWDVI